MSYENDFVDVREGTFSEAETKELLNRFVATRTTPSSPYELQRRLQRLRHDDNDDVPGFVDARRTEPTEAELEQSLGESDFFTPESVAVTRDELWALWRREFFTPKSTEPTEAELEQLAGEVEFFTPRSTEPTAAELEDLNAIYDDMTSDDDDDVLEVIPEDIKEILQYLKTHRKVKRELQMQSRMVLEKLKETDVPLYKTLYYGFKKVCSYLGYVFDEAPFIVFCLLVLDKYLLYSLDPGILKSMHMFLHPTASFFDFGNYAMVLFMIAVDVQAGVLFNKRLAKLIASGVLFTWLKAFFVGLLGTLYFT